MQTAARVLPPRPADSTKSWMRYLGLIPTPLRAPPWTLQSRCGGREEEENGSDGGGPNGDTLESLEPCSQELFLSQEEGSQSQRPVLGGGQTEEQVPAASTLRPQPSLLSPAQRLQRLRKRPRKSKEDMLQEVMRQSIKENEKAQDWRARESRICQENTAHRRQSTAHRQQSTDRLISILECQADAIQELVIMQKEEQYRKRKCHPPYSPCPKTLSVVPHCHLQPTFPNFRVLHATRCLQHQYLHHPALKTTTLTLCTQLPSPCSIAVLKCSTHCTAH
ncbi:uncharacterized protein LOC128835652 [Malaclemys terrapin pileata]|uniref:uncharacterized protein LOC128835652 n=1 Tax=Malaclemys terrapin pileata TaxID=2991368 RepID=UPI0023A84695|nr:uncharacterized protein LOC128835652 [Malaclemys terrapin pileata]